MMLTDDERVQPLASERPACGNRHDRHPVARRHGTALRTVWALAGRVQDGVAPGEDACRSERRVPRAHHDHVATSCPHRNLFGAALVFVSTVCRERTGGGMTAERSRAVTLGTEGDAQPATAAAWGRDDALLALYTAHFVALVNVASFLLDGPLSAEDVVQEAFIRVQLSRSLLRDPNAALAYLRRTVINLSHTSLRRTITGRRLTERNVSGQTSVADASIGVGQRDALVRALRTLSRREREAVVLRFYADLSERETAEVMAVSIGAVKAYTSRALAGLKRRLKSEDPHER